MKTKRSRAGLRIIKAIPTEYNGIQLKSRFEAQMALLLDYLGWEWEYEPKSFMLPNGVAYIPDFLVPDHGIFIECRGYVTRKGEAQIKGFRTLMSPGIEHRDWGIITSFLVVRGDREASFYSAEKSTKMVLLTHCSDCGWWMAPVDQTYCVSCLSPLENDSKITASAIVTASKGRLLVNGQPSDQWGWIADLSSESRTE